MNPTTDEDMKSEYDFSGGKRGQFYQPNVKLNLPVYLDAEVVSYLNTLPRSRASRSRRSLTLPPSLFVWRSQLLLKKEIEIIEAAK